MDKRTLQIVSGVSAVALVAIAVTATDSFAGSSSAGSARPAAAPRAAAPVQEQGAAQADGFVGARLAVPKNLVPPPGNVMTSVFKARGVQNYGCVDGAWTLNEPAAVLTGIALKPLKRVSAIHFRGPSWQSDTDGTLVEGQNPKSAPSDTPNSIPQLLIEAKRTTGEGTFGGVTFVQRLATVGGLAPAGKCPAAGATTAVAYTAVYRFFKKGA